MRHASNRDAPPAPATGSALDFPETVAEVLPNGLELRSCCLPGLPLASATLYLRAGETDLPEERAGLAVLAGGALDGGTLKRDGHEMAERLESIGARLEVSVGWEGTAASVSCPVELLSRALPLLAEYVREPAFGDREVNRVRDQQMAGIRSREREPAGMAADEASRRYFAPGDPFARPRTGDRNSLSSATNERVREFADERYRPEGAVLAVAGDVRSEDLYAQGIDLLGDWSGSSPRYARTEPKPRYLDRRIWVVDRPGSVQSEIRVGHIGVSVRTPDRFPLLIGNLALGGTFSSRLNLALRERHGFTYGVGSGFAMRSRSGPFEVSTSVGSAVTARAVREILAELEAFARDGPTAEEVTNARRFAVGKFGLGLETAAQIASRIVFAFAHGLPADYYRSYRDRVNRVTRREVALAAKRRVRPAECQIVVVGDAASVVPDLEALDVAAMEAVTGFRPATAMTDGCLG